MADNLNFLDAASVSQVVAFDLVGGVYYQRAKMVWGVDGTVSDVSASAPMPVDTEIGTANLNLAGTDTRAAMGLLLAASGGAAVWPGDTTYGAKVQVAQAPAVARSVDGITVTHAVDRLANNLTLVAPNFAAISASASGANTLVAAQGSGNFVLVHQLWLIAAAAVTIRFQSAAGGTALSGIVSLAANSGIVLPFSQVGWFKTAANALLNLELGSAVSVAGSLAYTVVT